MILCKNRDRVLYHFTPSSVEKREILSLNFFRQINYLVIKHEYLRSRASRCLSLSSSFPVMVSEMFAF